MSLINKTIFVATCVDSSSTTINDLYGASQDIELLKQECQKNEFDTIVWKETRPNRWEGTIDVLEIDKTDFICYYITPIDLL